MLIKGIVAASNTSLCGSVFDGTYSTALQRVANRPIVCHALDALLAAGVMDVAVVGPRDVCDQICACVGELGPSGVEVCYLPSDDGRGVHGVLPSIAAFVGDAPCVVHLADGLLGQPLAPFVELLGEETSDLMLLLQQGAAGCGRLELAARRLLRVAELDLEKSALGIAGVCLFGPGALRRAHPPRLFAGEQLDLTIMAERLAAAGGRIHARVVRGWRRYAGNSRDLLDMNRTMLDALPLVVDSFRVDGSRVEGRVAIDATARVTSSVILGPTIVGAGARVADAYIGPYTSIGEGVRIEGVEIERSIILAGASIMHVGQRLEASVVGQGARIFRDFSLPRAMRLQVGDGVEVALC